MENVIDVMEKPVGIKDAAEYLGRTENAVYILVHRNKIPHHRGARKLYFFISELRAWIYDSES